MTLDCSDINIITKRKGIRKVVVVIGLEPMNPKEQFYRLPELPLSHTTKLRPIVGVLPTRCFEQKHRFNSNARLQRLNE